MILNTTMQYSITTITSARHLTLPKRLCEQLGIKRGGKVAVTVEHGAIMLTPMRIVIEAAAGNLHPARSTNNTYP